MITNNAGEGTNLTISLAMLTTKYVEIATDRRITTKGKILSDEQEKSCLLFTDNFKGAVAYSGLSKAGSINAHNWMMDSLEELAPPDFDIRRMVNAFRDRLTQLFRT